jgi:hypothetical protein
MVNFYSFYLHLSSKSTFKNCSSVNPPWEWSPLCQIGPIGVRLALSAVEVKSVLNGWSETDNSGVLLTSRPQGPGIAKWRTTEHTYCSELTTLVFVTSLCIPYVVLVTNKCSNPFQMQAQQQYDLNTNTHTCLWARIAQSPQLYTS